MQNLSKQELIIKGAELTTKKRKLLDDITIVSSQIKKWEKDLLEYAQQESISTFEICTTPEQVETFGESGVFQITTSTDYESLSKKVLDKLCTKFYTKMFPGLDAEEIEKFAKGQANVMWKDREVLSKTVIDRSCPNTGKKQKKSKEPKKPKTATNDLPSTYEDFMNLELGKSFEAAIKQSNA
jgi:hypothetical protein